MAVNDQIISSAYEDLADPVISPDGGKILVKGVANGIYTRRVLPVNK